MFSFFKKKKKITEEVVNKEEKKVIQTIPVPRIKTNQFIETLEAIEGMNEENMPICSPLFGDLLVTYSLDIGDSYISASPSICEEYKINIDKLPLLASTNAMQLMRDMKFNTDGTIYELITGNDLEACTILFPELWLQISGEIGGDVLAIVPHRNNIFYTRSDSSEGIVALNNMLGKFNFNDTHSLSKNLYLFSKGQWSVHIP